MVETIQTNIRIPAGAKKAMMRVAQLLRESPTFAHRLQRLLDEEQNPQLGALFSQRLDRLEAQMQAILAEKAQTKATIAENVTEAAKHIARSGSGARTANSTSWTTGEGRGRRLTDAGRAELDRLIGQGRTDSEVAAQIGIKPYAVRARRLAASDGS